jgi:OOP family OmpA-OmpF porin
MKRLFVGALLALLCATAWADDDADGCKDHPLFNRLKGYHISSCDNVEFDAYKFPVGAPMPDADPAYKFETVEGRRSELTYYPDEGRKPASALQVIRNFQAAARAAGGTVEGEYEHGVSDLSGIGGGHRATTVKIVKGGHEAWALVRGDNDGGPYSISLVEREAMRQDIVANELLDAINKNGFVALYINFDTGKATIKPDSAKTLDDAAAALKGVPDLKLEVAGHTDNVGGADANRKLSEARAQSVMQALVTRGIAAARLTAKGYGPDKPVADNSTEPGRAKNRRVELIKR